MAQEVINVGIRSSRDRRQARSPQAQASRQGQQRRRDTRDIILRREKTERETQERKIAGNRATQERAIAAGQRSQSSTAANKLISSQIEKGVVGADGKKRAPTAAEIQRIRESFGGGGGGGGGAATPTRGRATPQRRLSQGEHRQRQQSFEASRRKRRSQVKTGVRRVPAAPIIVGGPEARQKVQAILQQAGQNTLPELPQFDTPRDRALRNALFTAQRGAATREQVGGLKQDASGIEAQAVANQRLARSPQDAAMAAADPSFAKNLEQIEALQRRQSQLGGGGPIAPSVGNAANQTISGQFGLAGQRQQEALRAGRLLTDSTAGELDRINNIPTIRDLLNPLAPTAPAAPTTQPGAPVPVAPPVPTAPAPFDPSTVASQNLIPPSQRGFPSGGVPSGEGAQPQIDQSLAALVGQGLSASDAGIRLLQQGMPQAAISDAIRRHVRSTASGSPLGAPIPLESLATDTRALQNRTAPPDDVGGFNGAAGPVGAAGAVLGPQPLPIGRLEDVTTPGALAENARAISRPAPFIPAPSDPGPQDFIPPISDVTTPGALAENAPAMAERIRNANALAANTGQGQPTGQPAPTQAEVSALLANLQARTPTATPAEISAQAVRMGIPQNLIQTGAQAIAARALRPSAFPAAPVQGPQAAQGGGIPLTATDPVTQAALVAAESKRKLEAQQGKLVDQQIDEGARAESVRRNRGVAAGIGQMIVNANEDINAPGFFEGLISSGAPDPVKADALASQIEASVAALSPEDRKGLTAIFLEAGNPTIASLRKNRLSIAPQPGTVELSDNFVRTRAALDRILNALVGTR